MFVSVVLGVALNDDGERILDGIDTAHGLRSQPAGPTVRRYQFTHFEDNGAAIAWLEAQGLTFRPDAQEHVQFGVPGAGFGGSPAEG
jgi:hypothetical protein